MSGIADPAARYCGGDTLEIVPASLAVRQECLSGQTGGVDSFLWCLDTPMGISSTARTAI